jgi:hypothetical protein
MFAETSDPHLHDSGIYYCPGMSGEKWELNNLGIQELRNFKSLNS